MSTFWQLIKIRIVVGLILAPFLILGAFLLSAGHSPATEPTAAETVAVAAQATASAPTSAVSPEPRPVISPEPSPVASPTPNLHAWNEFATHVRSATKKGRVLSRDIQRIGFHDPVGYREAAKALRTWGRKELVWLDGQPASDCYAFQHRVWATTVWGWIHAADKIVEDIHGRVDKYEMIAIKSIGDGDLRANDSMTKVQLGWLAESDGTCYEVEAS